jgi:hypothetical protein
MLSYLRPGQIIKKRKKIGWISLRRDICPTFYSGTMETYQRPPWKPRSTARPYIAFSNGTDIQKTSPDRYCGINVPSGATAFHSFSPYYFRSL